MGSRRNDNWEFCNPLVGSPLRSILKLFNGLRSPLACLRRVTRLSGLHNPSVTCPELNTPDTIRSSLEWFPRPAHGAFYEGLTTTMW